MTMTYEDPVIEEILKKHTKKILEIVNLLRDFLAQEFPNFQEKGYPVWKGLGYKDPKCGYICGIFPYEDHVQIGFEYGILLKDKDKLLEGDGKQVRYITMHTTDDINEKAIKDFLKQSLALPTSKKDKMAMVDMMRKR